MTDRLKIFVGTAANGEDAEACVVLEYSLRRHASVDVDIEWLALSRDAGSPTYSDPERDRGWRTDRWPTPWSGLRWAVPPLMGWQGRAVYLDCPQVVVGDIAELADSPITGSAMVAVRRSATSLRTACMVWDCRRARRWLPDLDTMQREVGTLQELGHMLVRRPSLTIELPAGWAVEDSDYSYDPVTATGSIHCKNLHMQPHTRHALTRLRHQGREHWWDGTRLPHYCEPLVQLFDAELAAALAAGYRVEDYVPAERPYETYAIRGRDGDDLRRAARLQTHGHGGRR